jgi:hypothetical protein
VAVSSTPPPKKRSSTTFRGSTRATATLVRKLQNLENRPKTGLPGLSMSLV